MLFAVNEIPLLLAKVNEESALRVPPFNTISVSTLPGVAPKLAEFVTEIVPALILIAPVNDDYCLTMLVFLILA